MDLTITLFVVSAIIGVMGFFIRNAYGVVTKDINRLKDDSQKNIEEHGKLKGKIELLEQESRLKLQHIEETTQHEIKNMASKVGELSDMVGELVRIQLNGGPTRGQRR